MIRLLLALLLLPLCFTLGAAGSTETLYLHVDETAANVYYGAADAADAGGFGADVPPPSSTTGYASITLHVTQCDMPATLYIREDGAAVDFASAPLLGAGAVVFAVPLGISRVRIYSVGTAPVMIATDHNASSALWPMVTYRSVHPSAGGSGGCN